MNWILIRPPLTGLNQAIAAACLAVALVSPVWAWSDHASLVWPLLRSQPELIHQTVAAEPLAAAGRRPPLDPSNSLTRIGVGTAKTLKASGATPAMQELNKALRLELAAASDPAGCEPTQQRRATAITHKRTPRAW